MQGVDVLISFSATDATHVNRSRKFFCLIFQVWTVISVLFCSKGESR